MVLILLPTLGLGAVQMCGALEVDTVGTGASRPATTEQAPEAGKVVTGPPPAATPKEAQQPRMDEQGRYLAPDGVPYADEFSYEAMQLESLSDNLLRNGGFEEGRYWPQGWDPTDRLGIFWVAGGTKGRRCIRLYTDLLDEQWVGWNDRVLKLVQQAAARTSGKPQSLPRNPVPAPPERQPTSPPYYDTVAGIHGIHYRSARIPIKETAIYRVSVDMRRDGGGDPMVFTKGFFRQRGLWRNAGRATLFMHNSNKQWQRWAYTLHPCRWKSTIGGKPLRAEALQVQLYAYWPPGSYFFDNVRLDIVGYEEPAKEEQDEAARTKKERSAPSLELDDEGFPVLRH